MSYLFYEAGQHAGAENAPKNTLLTHLKSLLPLDMHLYTGPKATSDWLLLKSPDFRTQEVQSNSHSGALP